MKKIKVLCVSDDIRIPSGVGIQCKKILTGLQKTGKYECIELAGSLIKSTMQPLMYEGVKLYPTGGEPYGNSIQLKTLLQIERPDIVLLFSDPRFFQYTFNMDDEIRQHSKLVFFHTWDNAPFPKFNIPYYNSCDTIVLQSEFSYNLLKEGGIDCYHIPPGQNSEEFYPLPDNEIQKELDHFKSILKMDTIDFIIFYNNRNLDRKRPADVINIFEKFNKVHPNSVLFMNTNPVDPEGVDLLQLQKDLIQRKIPIIFNFTRINTEKLNRFYNVSDVIINLSYAEGFGICVSESLMAATPVIATRTGGMTEQMSQIIHHNYEVEEQKDPSYPITSKGRSAYDEEEVYGVLIEPKVKNLFGTPGSYIFRDYVNDNDVLNALEKMYQLKKSEGIKKMDNLISKNELQDLGLKGREYVKNKYNEVDLIKRWDELLEKVDSTPSNYQRIQLKTV